ncbi:MAG TPA: hypothetical protein PLN52_07480 [Opitutaceae bacterium]|nr:hypothetical protein [Opitutaceae bacterium]
MRLTTSTRFLACVFGLFLAAQLPASAQQEVPPMTKITNLASEWIPLYGEAWWNYYHKDYEGFYPGGRSNLMHDAYLARVRKNTALTVDWQIFNRRYTYDGEYFAVEWFYRATNVADGFRQWEATLGIGRIKDGKMVLWTEYFDDSVGVLQQLGLMPFYDKDEAPFPWPEKAVLHLPYRP